MPIASHLGAWYARPNGALILGNPAFFSGPGFAYGYGYDPATPAVTPFTVGSKFNLGFTTGLKRWDGGTFVDAGATELESFTGGNPAAPSGVARTSDIGPFASLPVQAGAGSISFTGDGDEVHSTVRYRLLGDGSLPSSASPDGVYLVSLQLSISSSDKAPSDPFYFVLHKGAPSGEIQAAVNSLGVAPGLIQAVPEPATILPASCGMAALAAARRRLRSYKLS